VKYNKKKQNQKTKSSRHRLRLLFITKHNLKLQTCSGTCISLQRVANTGTQSAASLV